MAHDIHRSDQPSRARDGGSPGGPAGRRIRGAGRLADCRRAASSTPRRSTGMARASPPSGPGFRSRGGREDVVLLTKGAHPDERDWSSRMSPGPSRLTSARAWSGSASTPSTSTSSIVTTARSRSARSSTRWPRRSRRDEPAPSASRTGRSHDWTRPRPTRRSTAGRRSRGAAIRCRSRGRSANRGQVSSTRPTRHRGPGSRRTPTRLLAWSPTGNGYFAPEADLSSPKFDAYRTRGNEARRARAIEFGRRRGLSATQVALAWVMSQPFAPIAIVGTRSVRHLHEALAAEAVRLTEAELAWLEHGDTTRSRRR